MCLAVPARIIEKSGAAAIVDVEGNRVRADLSMLPEAEVGEYVLLHAGFAISKYTQEEAEETLRLLREMSRAGG